MNNIGDNLATFASCRLLKEKSGKYPKSKKNRNRTVCGEVWKLRKSANRVVFRGLKNKQEKDTGLQLLPRVGSQQTATPTAMRFFALLGLTIS